MCLKDIFGTMVIKLLGRDRPWKAGGFDALGDYAALFCIGYDGAAIRSQGLTTTNAGVLAALGVGSAIGTYLGWRLDRWLSHR